MSVGSISVRNACPFPVTFYALAGPTIELGPGETKSAQACAIWFSTRVKGPGDAFNQGTFEALRKDYINQLVDLGADAYDWEEGGTGAAAGSILGGAIGAIEQVFKVKNTRYNGDMYFGDKKEGVYGGSSKLVVYPTLDPACSLGPNLKKIWFLHLETDHGQHPGLEYVMPDMTPYIDVMFFRLRNDDAQARYLFANTDNRAWCQQATVGYNPFEFPEYWTMIPIEGNGRDIKIVNTLKQAFLVGFDWGTGMLPINKYTDYPDQHWSVETTNGKVYLHCIGRGYQQLYGHKDGKTGYRADKGPDQIWTVETFADTLNEIPTDHSFRIMHCQTGRYLTVDGTSVSLQAMRWDQSQLFMLEKHGDNDFKLRSCVQNGSLVCYGSDKNLGIIPPGYGDYSDQHWGLELPANRCGFLLCNKAQPTNSNHLYHNGHNFGIAGGDFVDQHWIVHLDYVRDFG